MITCIQMGCFMPLFALIMMFYHVKIACYQPQLHKLVKLHLHLDSHLFHGRSSVLTLDSASPRLMEQYSEALISSSLTSQVHMSSWLS